MNPYWLPQYPQLVPSTNQFIQPQFVPQYVQQQQLLPQFMQQLQQMTLQQPQQIMSQQQCGAPSVVPTARSRANDG